MPAAADAWSVDLDLVDAQIDALWIDEFNFEPGGHVTGGLHWVDGELAVPRTTVRTQGSTLWLAQYEAVRQLVGEGSLAIEAFDTSQVGEDMASYLSFDYEGDGVVVDPSGLAIWWPDVAGIVAGDPGPVEISARADHGSLRAGTRIHHHAARAELGTAELMLAGEADLVLAVGDDGRPSATVTLANARLEGAEGELARSDALYGVVRTTHGDLARPWALAITHVETGEVVTPSLAKLAALAEPDGWKITRGHARGHAVLDLGPDEIPVAAVALDVEDARLVTDEVQIAAALEASGRLRYLPGGTFVAEDLRVRTDALRITTASGTSDGTWVRVADATARYEGGTLEVDARGRVEDARPAAVHLTRLDPLLEAVPDLERIAPVKVRTKLLLRQNLVELDVESEQLGVNVATLWRKRADRWRLAVWASGLTAFGFTSTEAQLLRQPLILAGKDWYQAQRRWVRQLAAPPQG